jgi:hypothetical protein
MQRIVLAAVMAISGCASFQREPAAPAEVIKPQHPMVRVEGIDGTIFRGELLNGSVTVDSGQGELTLLTDHIKSIVVSSSGDVVDSDSVKVSGRIVEKQFLLQSEHGVFTLLKERLRKIDFSPGASISSPASTAPVTHRALTK